ncbi:MAG: hypothetical protein UW91_C0014G0001, partial [Parcubacteria group bacterium GW2011_GWF2_45_11]
MQKNFDYYCVCGGFMLRFFNVYQPRTRQNNPSGSEYSFP